jgi:DNA-directed RNA polymerase specialized sigma24 family protein
VAASLRIPNGTAKSRLHHALADLRVQVADDDATADDRVPGGQLA